MIRSGVMRIGREHGNSYNGKGLKHIDWKHVQTLGDFESLEEAIDVIEDVIKNGEIKPDKDPQNIALEKNHYRVVIARDKNGNWVLTAFDKDKSVREKKKRKDTFTLVTPGQLLKGQVLSPLIFPKAKILKIRVIRKKGENLSVK